MLGIHIAKASKIREEKSKTMLDAIKRDVELLGINACQIFTHGPQGYGRNGMDYEQIRKYCSENNIHLSSHGTYVSVSLWKVNHSNKDAAASKKSISHIIDMLVSVKKLGGSGVVIHLPRNSPEVVAESLEILSENKEIAEIQRNGPDIILEMPASAPSEFTYETAEKLNNLCDAIKSKNMSLKWSLCIDTSHQWSCGIEMNKLHVWHDWLQNISDFTKEKIKIIHLNGNSVKNFGRGKDVHEIIMSPEDGIWGGLMSKEMSDFIEANGPEIIEQQNDFYEHLTKEELHSIEESSLFDVIKFAKKNNAQIILEINRGDFIYTKFAMDILKKFIL